MKPVHPPFKRALRDLFRVEPLEARVLLSADPVLGAAQVVLKPADPDPAAAVAQAYAAPADVNLATAPGATVLVADNAQQPAGTSGQWLLVDTAQLADGNGRVVVGGPDSNAVIHVGDAQVGDLVLMNPQAGGEVFLDGALQLSGSLMIEGSGHTTTVAADITSIDDIVIADSVMFSGNRIVDAGTDGAGSIQLGANTATTINGDGIGSPDSLVLHAADNVRFTGPLGSTDPLAGITIAAVSVGGTPNLPNNVNFDREVTVNGDLLINATGTVTFSAKVVLANGGDLRILGASNVVFQGGLELQGVDAFGNAGDIFIEANEIDFLAGTESVKGAGVLTLRPSSVGFGIDIGSLPASTSQPSTSTLNLETSELKALADGFSRIVIGQQDGLHANAAAGNVRIGAIDALSQPTLRDPLEVYGGTVSVEDLDNPDYQLLVLGTLTLDAHGDITVANRVEANTGSGVTDITLYSDTGKVQQVDATGDLRSAEPLKAATLNVHAATGISLPFTEITSVSATNTASGDLSITETATGGDVAITLLSQQAANAGIALKTTAGSITVGGTGMVNAGSGLTELQAAGSGKSITVNQDIHSASGTIRLTAAGAIATNDDTGSVTHGVIATDGAGGVQLVASGGAIQQGADILSVGGLVSLDAGTGITMADGVKAQSLGLGSGVVSLQARAGNATVSIVNADASIGITAAGAILDGLTGNNPNLDGETAAVLLAAASGIGTSGTPLQTRVNALAASNTTTGGVFLREATALRIAGGAGTFAVDAGGGDGSVSITTLDGAITIEKAVRTSGAIGHMLLQTGELAEATPAGIDIRADVTSAHGSLSVLSADGLTVDDLLAGSAPTVSVAGSGQTLDVQAATSIATEGNARFATAGGTLHLTADSGDVALGVADAGSGSVSIQAGGSILDAQADDAAPAANVVAASAHLVGAAGIGQAGALFDTQVATLAALATGGPVFLAERDALAVGTVAASAVNRVSAQGTTGATIADASLSGITSSAGVVLRAGGNLSVDQAVNAAGNLRIDAGGALDISAGVATTSGALTAIAAGTVTVASTGSVASIASLDVRSTGGSVAMADGSVASTQAATVRLQAALDVTVGRLDARSAADRAGNTALDFPFWGAVSIVAGGSILDNAGETAVDVQASIVRLQAGSGIGSGSEHLELYADTLAASAGAAGLFLTDAVATLVNSTGPVHYDRVGLDGQVSSLTDANLSGLASGGAAVLQAGAGLFLGQAVSAGGNVLLQTQAAGFGLFINAAVSSTGGDISIASAGVLRQNAAITASGVGHSVDLLAAGLIAQDASVGTITTNDGNIALDSGDDVTVGLLSAGTGGVWISGHTLTDADGAGDSTVDIAAGSAQLLADNGIGAAGAALETQVATLSARGGPAVFVTESDGVTVDRLQVQVNRVATDGSVAATAHAAQEGVAGATVVLGTLAGDLTLNAGTAGTDAVFGGPGNLRLEAAAGRVVVAGNITSSNGSLSVLGATGVAFQGAGGIAASGGTVDIAASGGAVGMDDGTGVLSGGGAIRVQASGDVTVGKLDAGTGSVSVVAGGSIADNAGETSIDIVAGALRLQAAGGIGSGSEALETWVGQLSASAGAAGLFLTEADAVAVTQTAAVGVNRVGSDGVTLTAQTDGVQAGLASGGALVLQAGGTVTGASAIGAAGNLYLKADGTSSDLVTGAAVGSSGGSLELIAGRDVLLGADVSAAAAGKSVEVSAARDVTQAQGTSVGTSNGGIVVTGGSVAANGIAGTVTLESLNAGTAGVQVGAQSIVDGDGAGDTEVDIVAGGAALFAGAGIGAAGAALETTVDTLKASAGGGVFMTESDAVAIDTVSVSYQQVDASGAATDAVSSSVPGLSGAAVVLRTLAGGIASAAGAAVAASGNLLLQAGGASSDIVLAGTASAGGAMSLLAGRDVTLKSSVGATGGSIDVQAAGRIDAQQGSAIASANGNVQLLALGGSVALESVNAGTGTVRISGSSIIDGDIAAGETEVDIVGGQLLLTATSSAGTGANPLETTVGALSVSAASTVGIVESDGLVLDTVTASVDRVAADGTTSATAPVTQAHVSGSTVTLRTLAGALSATAGGAVTASGNVLLKAGGASGDMTLGASVGSSGGNISLDAGRDMTLAAAVATAGAGKTIDLQAAGALTQSQGSTLTTTNGHASLAAGGVLTIETVSAGIGRVSLGGSSIVDGDAAGDTEVDILAAGVRATATAGGIGSAANPLESTISTLSAVATGDVFVTETDALDLAVVSATINRVGSNGADAPVTLSAQSHVSGATVVVRTLGGSLGSQATGAVSATGNLLLSAGGASSDLNLTSAVASSGGHVSLAAGQDIVLGANVSAAAGGQAVDLVAGRNFTQAQGTAVTSAGGNIGLQAGGSATLETFNAGAGSVRIAAASVADGDTAANETEVDVTGASLQLVATGAVGAPTNALETTVGTLAASAGGNLFLAESDALGIAALAVDTQRVGTDGTSASTANATTSGLAAATAVVQAAGAIDSVASVAITATGNLLLKTLSASDITLLGDASAAGDLTLESGRDLVLGGAVASTGAGRSLVLQANRAFTQSQGSSAGSNDGTIVVTASDNATLESLAAGTGTVRISANSVIDGDTDGDSQVDVTAGALGIVANIPNGAIGTAANALETTVGSIALSAAQGGVFVTESDALLVDTVGGTAQRVGTDGGSQALAVASVANVQGDQVVLRTLAGSLTTSAGGGLVEAAGNLRLSAGGAGSDLVTNAMVRSDTGDLSLAAGRDLLLGADVRTDGTGTDVDLLAQRNFVQAQGTAARTFTGNIALQAGGDATIESLLASGGGIWASAARLLDGDAAGDAEVDLTAPVVQLTTTGAIGAAGNALETTAATLTAQGGGDVFLTETDALTVGTATVDVRRVDASGVTTSSAHAAASGLGGATVVLRTVDGALATQAAVSATGKLLLQAGGAAGDLAVQAGATAGGALSLEAGRDLRLASSVGSTGGTVDAQAQGVLTASEGTAITTANANVLLQAGGDVTIDTVDAGSGSGSVRIAGAHLIDGDSGAGETEVDIVASQLQVSATGAVGAAANPLETTVGTLAVAAGGLVNIVETDALLVGATSFGGVDRVGADGATSGTGTVTQGNVVAGGELTLTVGGTLDLAAAAALASTGGNLVATANGDVTMAAGSSMETSGPATIALTSNAGRVMMEPDLSALSTGSGDIHVTAEGDIQPGALITQGKAYLDARNGSVLIRGDLQRNGEDVDLFGDDLVIEVPVASPGGTLRIGPLDPGTSIVIGDTVPAGPALQVDTGELALLQDGFAQLEIGSSLADTAILLDGATSPLVFHDPLLLTATGAGGTVQLQGSLTGESLTIADAGDHTTLAASTVVMQGSVLVQDQLAIAGANAITGSGSLHFTQTVTGAGGAADTLALDAGGGSVALDQAVANLDGLSISNAGDVTFGAAVTLSGDLVIDATGTVTFDGPLTLTNGAHLIVRGGGRVVFNGSADLGQGDALLQVAGIQANGGTGSLVGTGLLQVRGTTASQAIHVGGGTAAAGALVVGDDVLRAVGAGFTALRIGNGAQALTLGDADLSATGAPVELVGDRIALVATSGGVRLGTDLTLHAVGNITTAGQLQATAASGLTLTSDTGTIAMAAGSTLASQGGPIALQAARGLAVAGLDARSAGGAGTVSLRSASGTITDANADAAVNVYAQAVDFAGRGTMAGSAEVLEVSAPVVRVDPAGGIVLRDSGSDGRVYYNVLHGSDLEQVLVAVGASQRVTTDPDAFLAGGGMQLLAASGGSVRNNAPATALSRSLGSSTPSYGNTQVQTYLASADTAGDAGLTLSQRLQAQSELSFASGQPAGGATGVDYWTESLSV